MTDLELPGRVIPALIAFLNARLDEDEAMVAEPHIWPTTFRPERVLREVEAKRMLLEQFRLRGNSVRATVQPVTGGVWDDLLRILALPYADHPDYRQEWAP